MGGSKQEVGHPNFQSLYRESNSRGILVGCPAPGGGVAYSNGVWGVNDKGLTLTGNVIGNRRQKPRTHIGSEADGEARLREQQPCPQEHPQDG